MKLGQCMGHDRIANSGCLRYLALATATLLAGCGAASTKTAPVTPPANETLTITTQPADAYVPLGSTGTFSVAATGASQLQYQWSENGTEITGATSASYTTPTVSADNSGESYQVTVTDGFHTLTSSNATLTVGPRAPKPGDLRYLLWSQVSVPGLGQDGGLVFNMSAQITLSQGNAVGTPLSIGDGCVAVSNCGWGLQVDELPPGDTGLSMYYTSNSSETFTSDLASLLTPNSVVMSMDLSVPYGEYAVGQVLTAGTLAFDGRLEIVDPSQVQATAAADGAASRIITAVTYADSAHAYLLSYGWQGDTSTVYEAKTVETTSDGVIAAATQLASEGYAISAFGGNNTIGFILVGIRVQGDTMPRPINIYTNNNQNLAPNPGPGYFTQVIGLYPKGGGNTQINEQ